MINTGLEGTHKCEPLSFSWNLASLPFNSVPKMKIAVIWYEDSLTIGCITYVHFNTSANLSGTNYPYSH